MNNSVTTTALKRLGQLLAVCFLMLLNTACNRIDEAIWTEEVKLHDGQMIQVWRRATAYANGFPNARRGRDIEFEFRYEPMGVYWKGSPYLEPSAFEIFDGVPYLVLYADTRGYCEPNRYKAKFLRWENGVWKEIPQTEFPVEKAIHNLYIRYWGHGPKDDAKGLITWEHKAMRDGFKAEKPETVKGWFESYHRYCN